MQLVNLAPAGIHRIFEVRIVFDRSHSQYSRRHTGSDIVVSRWPSVRVVREYIREVWETIYLSRRRFDEKIRLWEGNERLPHIMTIGFHAYVGFGEGDLCSCLLIVSADFSTMLFCWFSAEHKVNRHSSARSSSM
jgi:hypothetical protein